MVTRITHKQVHDVAFEYRCATCKWGESCFREQQAHDEACDVWLPPDAKIIKKLKKKVIRLTRVVELVSHAIDGEV